MLKQPVFMDYRTQNIKTVNIVNKSTILVLKKRRYVCPNCGKRFYEHYDFIAKHHHIAKNVFIKIINDLKELRAIKSIAKANNVSANTVQRALKFADCIGYSELPEVLRIDEFKGNAAVKNIFCKYQTLRTKNY